MRRGLGFIIWVVLVALQSNVILVSGIDTNKSIPAASLNNAILEYANKSLKQSRTGIIYNVSLPQTLRFEGIEVSVVRFRSSTFWVRGVNFSYFQIPPRIIAIPYVERLVIVFENLQNMSSQYYQVPGYQLITPVVGFAVYGASNNSLIGSQKKLNLSIMGSPISIRFPSVPEIYTNGMIRCVMLDTNKSFEFNNMTSPSVCSAQNQGHFSLAIPLQLSNSKEEGNELWKWWVFGFVGGFVVLVLSGLLLLSIHKLMVRRKIMKMEKQSDQDVPLGTFYVGRSKMPSASMIRTQPLGVENGYVP